MNNTATRPTLKDALVAADEIKVAIKAKNAAGETPDQIAFEMGFTRRSVVAVISDLVRA